MASLPVALAAQEAELPDELPHPSENARLLGLRLWVIETMPADRAAIAASMQAHIRYQLMLEREGTMFAAGPIFGADAGGPDGNGLIVIRAGSMEDAVAIAEADPMHASGGRTWRLRQWVVNEGSISLTIPFSRYHAPVIE